MPAIIYTMSKMLVLTIDGEFNLDAVERTRALVDELIDSHCDVLVDLSNVHCIDAAGIGALVYLYKQLVADKHNMSMICHPKSQPRHLFAILHIDRCIHCYDSMEHYLSVHESDNGQQPKKGRGISVAF